MPLIVAFIGILNPKLPATRDCETAPALILSVVAVKPSFELILVGLFHTAPLPVLVPVPAGFAPAVNVPPEGQLVDDDNTPLPPWQMIIPAVTGFDFTVIATFELQPLLLV